MITRLTNPYIRDINYIKLDPSFCTNQRKIYDNQFIFVHEGKGTITINDIPYEANIGDLFFYKANTVHIIKADKDTPFILSGIHFDFDNKHSAIKFPIGPFDINNFKKELIIKQPEFSKDIIIPDKVSLNQFYIFKDLITKMLYEFNHKKNYSKEILSGYLRIFIFELLREINSVSKKENDLVSKVLKYMNKNFNKEITNEMIGNIFHFHPNYINSLIVKSTSYSIRQYIIDIRIKRAIDLLISTNLDVSKVASMVGYDDIHYFSRLFKKKTGFNPSVIKKTSF